MPRNNGRNRRNWRYERAVERQIASVQRSAAEGRRYLYADVDEFLRPGDSVGHACVEPTCPDYGDPDFGEATCPAEHSGLVLGVRA